MYKNKINEIRRAQGLTMVQLAEITGVSAGYICHLEKGTRRNPSIEIMEKISLALNKNISEIFFIK